MALDAVSFMRARVRGTPSWPGHDPETGYVGADRSDHSQKLLADGAGHTFQRSVHGRIKAREEPWYAAGNTLREERRCPDRFSSRRERPIRHRLHSRLHL